MSIPSTPLNRLRQLWRDGRPAFGAIATIPVSYTHLTLPTILRV